MFALNALILLVGFFALIKGADLFVEGSSGIAKNFKVPSLIIGLTIVAFGTSAPELAVSASAALQGANEIALSNVIGSNIFNLLCVLGLCAIAHPVPVNEGILKRDFPLSLLATAFVLAGTGAAAIGRLPEITMEETVGTVNRIMASILLLVFIAYIVYLIYDARKHPETEERAELWPVWKCVFLTLTGLAMIIGGGQAVVYGAKEIARAAGMTETLIGLTIVAVGTSLPELVTSLTAATKGETELAFGNVIGSNLLNIMLILSVSALIHPISVNFASICDLAILLFLSALAFLFSFTAKTLTRTEGAILTALYIVDMIFAIMR